MWIDLEKTWKEVLKLAWEAYKRDTIPIGAVIVDEKGDIIAKGRNITYDSHSTNILAQTSMGHAEMVALMQLKKHEHPNINKYKLYVGLESCPMCFGAMLMVGIKNVYYAAEDSRAGSSQMKDKTEYIKSAGINLVKVGGDIEIFQIILQTSRGKYRPHKDIIDTWERDFSGAVSLGKKLNKERYFDYVMKKNKSIKLIFDEVIDRYYR